jgi:hypothetical protein
VWLTTTTEVVASVQDGGENRNVSALARVMDPYGPVAGASVTARLAGVSQSCTATTDSKGVASCAFLTEAKGSAAAVTVSFDGQTTAAKVRLASSGLPRGN